MYKRVIFIRGIPGSGKTWTANKLNSCIRNCEVINPDNIKIYSEEFKEFCSTQPVNTRLKILKYRYTLNRCVDLLKSKETVIWEQPWRKPSGIEITVRNIISRFNMGVAFSWTKDINELCKECCIKFFVLDIYSELDDAWYNCKKDKYKSSLFRTKSQFKSYCEKYKVFKLGIPVLNLNNFSNSALRLSSAINFINKKIV